jgi:hypothetical protein
VAKVKINKANVPEGSPVEVQGVGVFLNGTTTEIPWLTEDVTIETSAPERRETSNGEDRASLMEDARKFDIAGRSKMSNEELRDAVVAERSKLPKTTAEAIERGIIDVEVEPEVDPTTPPTSPAEPDQGGEQ